jgi:SWI/SNF-related matrix-associated actin-dependent regulator of chromatin subfamily A-like protein 1
VQAVTLPLLPYQVEGAKFLASNERVGLFDEPGVGKTAQAITALDIVKANRVIVVCPAAVRQVWLGEFKKFSAVPRRVLSGKTIQDLNTWLRGRADVLVTSYELASKWSKHIEDIYDVLILDESHYVKNSDTQRTRGLLGNQCDGKNGLAQWACRTWFLTGTPASNDPVDLWPFLRFTGACAMGLTPFTNRYFKSWTGTFSSKQVTRPEMVSELRDRIKSVSLRRTKEDAGLDIPPIWLTTQTVDGDSEDVRRLLLEHPGLEQAIVEALRQGGLSFLDAQHVATLRRLVGEAKAPAYAKLLAEELSASTHKVVVMGVHIHALQHVATVLDTHRIGAVVLNGSTTEVGRARAVEQFQNDPLCRVFIGNIRAAGTGLTLTASADIDMLESSWAPADNAQALMRVHRIGQTRKVKGRFISLADSIDDVVTETVRRKTESIVALGLDMVAMAD